jgi:hypothetical protein
MLITYITCGKGIKTWGNKRKGIKKTIISNKGGFKGTMNYM